MQKSKKTTGKAVSHNRACLLVTLYNDQGRDDGHIKEEIRAKMEQSFEGQLEVADFDDFDPKTLDTEDPDEKAKALQELKEKFEVLQVTIAEFIARKTGEGFKDVYVCLDGHSNPMRFGPFSDKRLVECFAEVKSYIDRDWPNITIRLSGCNTGMGYDHGRDKSIDNRYHEKFLVECPSDAKYKPDENGEYDGKSSMAYRLKDRLEDKSYLGESAFRVKGSNGPLSTIGVPDRSGKEIYHYSTKMNENDSPDSNQGRKKHFITYNSSAWDR